MSCWDAASLQYVKGLGADYIWYTGIPRHASGKDFVKGNPGSPYSISDWKDINPYLADCEENRMEEFQNLVSRTHDAGLGCIIDFIPNHVARDYYGPLEHYNHCDYDWTDTVKVNWNSPATRKEAAEILRFWASRGVDGFRCDMVELVSAEALKELISAVKRDFPDLLFIAEVYNKDNYRTYINAGFDLLYDKSGAYDILRGIICHGRSARDLTRNWQSLQDMQPQMLNFLENHDEQRAASKFFAGSAAKTWAALAYALLFNDASFLLYFGQEAGENASEGHQGRTSIFEWSKPATISRLYAQIHGESGLNADEAGVLARYSQMLSLAATPLFRKGSCWDLCYCQKEGSGFCHQTHSAFLRYGAEGACAVVCNFSDAVLKADVFIPAEPLGEERMVSVEAAAWDCAIVPIS